MANKTLDKDNQVCYNHNCNVINKRKEYNMKVEKDNKVLYHIQNMNMGSDGYPFDAYVWCDHFPNKDDLTKAFALEYGGAYGENEEFALKEWLTSSEVYAVYADEV